MIAVDTNVLVYAHRRDSPWHEAALARVTEVAQGAAPWAIPWPCLHEFFAIVTHPRIFDPPTKPGAALEQIAIWLESPTLMLLAEGSGYWGHLRSLVEGARIAGGLVHDARVAALCLEHGATELWTLDRDFSRFPALRCRNPLNT